MIEDLLVLARVDTGSRSLQLSTVNLDETLVDVVARLNRIADAQECGSHARRERIRQLRRSRRLRSPAKPF